MKVFVDPGALRLDVLHAPPSKSDAIRALATAHALGLAAPELGAKELPEDVEVFAHACGTLRNGTPATIDCRDGGAPFRFALALAAATASGEVSLVGSPRLGERPHAPLIEALRAAGATIELGSPWPIRVRPMRDPQPLFRVAANESSQFASALLLAAAARSRIERRAWTLELVGEIASAGYLDLTLQWLRAAGVRVASDGRRLQIDATASSSDTKLPPVPSDWSSLGYLLLIAWKIGARVQGVDLTQPHPDRAIVDLLRGVGLGLVPNARGTKVTGTPLRGLDTSVSAFPDLALTLTALACVLPEPSTLRDIGILRLKESDRVEGCCDLLRAFGREATVEGDTLRIGAKAEERHASFDAKGDHRRALSATTLAILLDSPLELTGAESVRKSFPGFFSELGLSLQ